MSEGAPATPASGYGMISVNEAQQIVLNACAPLASTTLPTPAAVGYVAAADDGYAVNSKDGPGEYPVEKACYAGKTGSIQLQPRTVDYIATGAPVPDGADAVVQIEDTEFLGHHNGKDFVKIKVAAKPGLDIRPIGSDIEAGAQILAQGDVIGAAEIGLLATVAQASVEVVQKPKVAILSTGDELVDFTSTKEVQFGEIRDANRPMLLSACRELGFETMDLGIVEDDEADIRIKVHSVMAHEIDVVICSGGVSMGSKDAVKPVLESMGSVHFGKVKMKPGKPLTFATLEAKGHKALFFGLPGNPVSSYACFHLFVLPALHKLQGWKTPGLRRIDVQLDNSIQLDPVRPEFARAIAQWKDGSFHAMTTGNQISSRLLSARSANVLLELPQVLHFGFSLVLLHGALFVEGRTARGRDGRFGAHYRRYPFDACDVDYLPLSRLFATDDDAMSNRGCYVRLQREYKSLMREPVDNVTALPTPTNLLEWHFVLEGAKGTDYEGGYYHGKIMFTTDYPFRPPSILLLTPNGRFATNMKICMSMTDYHPESWNPVWSVGTILAGLLSFLHDTQATTGSITSASKKKRELARASLEYNVKHPTFRKMFPELVRKFEEQKQRELLNQGKDMETVKKEIESFKNGGEAENRFVAWDTNVGVIISISLFAVAAAMMGWMSVPFFAK